MAGKGSGSEGEGGGSYFHLLYCDEFGLLWFEWFESWKFQPHWINSDCVGMLGGHYFTLSSPWACWTFFKNNYLTTPLFDQSSNALIWHDFIHFHYHPFPSSFHIASPSYWRFLNVSLTRFLCSEIFDCLEFVGLGRNGAIPAYSFPFNSRYSDLSWIIEHRLFSPLQTSQTGKVRDSDW